MTDQEAIRVSLRRSWVPVSNLRLSCEAEHPPWKTPCYRAVVLESVVVHPSMLRQGVFKRFLAELIKTPDTDLVIVECVGNPVLAAALERWGWEFDSHVMDFYHFPRGRYGTEAAEPGLQPDQGPGRRDQGPG